jgi:predicted acylesterase/phospholipase RssA/CRP-like cAMP-binding protein
MVIVVIGAAPSPATLRHGWIAAGACFLVLIALGTMIGRLRPADEDIAEDPPRPRLGRPAVDSPPPVDASSVIVQVGEGIDAFVRSVPMFAGLGEALQDRLATIAETISLKAGEFVFRRGDPVDGLYVVRSGRIDVILDSPHGIVRSQVARGEVLGELALLAEPRRSAAAQARRDSRLIRIPLEGFAELLHAGPELGIALSRRLARLVQLSVNPYSRPKSPLPATLAVLGAGGDAAALAAELEQHLGGSVATISGGDEQAGNDLLDLAEQQHDRVILVAENGAEATWVDFCARQGDAVVMAGSGPPPAEPAPAVERCAVVVGERAEVRPWLQAMAGIAEIVTAGPDGAARVGRRYGGRSVGLVLSGGGARALAHVGVLQELEALGVSVDRVAAAGTGALVGAMLACGWSGAEIEAQSFNELVRRRPFGDFRPRRTSLIRGRRVDAMLDRLFGDTWIEELPLQFACVSADLEHGERLVHRSGPLASAVRAAITIPGLMSPVAEGDRLLVDAGVLDNLPIDLLAREEGPIIAVDVVPRGQGPQRVESARRADVRNAQPAVPTIAETLARTMVLGSCHAAESARQRADLTILPDTTGVGMLEFHQIDVLRLAGRSATREALEGSPSLEMPSPGGMPAAPPTHAAND